MRRPSGSSPWPVNRQITYTDNCVGSGITKGKNSLAQAPLRVSLPTRLMPDGRQESRPIVLFGLIRYSTHPMIYGSPRILNEFDLCLELKASPRAQPLSIKNKCWQKKKKINAGFVYSGQFVFSTNVPLGMSLIFSSVAKTRKIWISAK